MATKKHPYLQLLEVDDLCLAALGDYFRCDRDANHLGKCAHYHSDTTLCNWLDSFTDDLTKKHQKIKVFGKQDDEVVPTKPQGSESYFPRGMGMV